MSLFLSHCVSLAPPPATIIARPTNCVTFTPAEKVFGGGSASVAVPPNKPAPRLPRRISNAHAGRARQHAPRRAPTIRRRPPHHRKRLRLAQRQIRQRRRNLHLAVDRHRRALRRPRIVLHAHPTNPRHIPGSIKVRTPGKPRRPSSRS